MTKEKRCYNCGKLLGKKEETKEHIPARTLFEGYDEKYKVNRITVPACFECNNSYSPTDKEFRNMIGIIAKQKENNTITKTSVKSILGNDSGYNRLRMNIFGDIIGVTFFQKQIEDFHKKNFKGLFYYQYGYPLPKNYELVVNIDENDYSNLTLSFIDYLKNYFEWKHSGHEDILSYCIQPFRFGIFNPGKKDLALNKDENLIIGILKYNREHVALVTAIRKEYLEGIKQREI